MPEISTQNRALERVRAAYCTMEWHIVNRRDYIDGPFDTYEAALKEALVLGKETRDEPRVRQRSRDFYVYRPPYDRRNAGSRSTGSAPKKLRCDRKGRTRNGIRTAYARLRPAIKRSDDKWKKTRFAPCR